MRAIVMLMAALLLLSVTCRGQEPTEPLATPAPLATSAASPGTPAPALSPTPTPAFSTPSSMAPSTSLPVVNTPAGDKGQPAAPYRPPTQGLGQLVGYLVLLVMLFVLGMYVMRNGIPSLRIGQRSAQKLQIEEMRSLGGRQFLVVAEYEGQKMLLGVCPGRIEHLRDLPSKSAPVFPEIGPEKVEETKG